MHCRPFSCPSVCLYLLGGHLVSVPWLFMVGMPGAVCCPAMSIKDMTPGRFWGCWFWFIAGVTP